MKTERPEILSPAGNPEKLRFAVDYGADAVYCALKKFGMRASSDNFDPDEFADGVRYAHSKGAKVYLTLNTMPPDSRLKELPAVLDSISSSLPDAFIVSDPGVMTVLRENVKDAVIHLSTQASTVNSEGCKFWYRNGVSRIVLARELSLADIRDIRKNIPDELELEAFVHGAMCISYSGRCLLSNYFTGRNANEGRCAQPCRWHYFFTEEKRPGDHLSTEQHDEGTYIFSSRDTCMIEHIDDLAECGISSFKIEGRMKSAYYTACVTNAYKKALNDYYASKPFDTSLLDEVEGVSHREYHTGFYYDNLCDTPNTVKEPGYLCEKPFYCYVMDYDEKTKTAKCFQKNKMFAHSDYQLLSPGTCGRDIRIEEIYDEEMQEIDSTPHPKSVFYIKLEGAKPGDIIRGK